MMWYGSRLHQRFVFRQVSRTTWQELGELPQIVGGQIELSTFADLKVSGTLDFKGLSIPDDGNLVRAYYGFADEAGESILLPLATLMFSVDEHEYDHGLISGTMECQSVLALAAARWYGMPFTVAAGTLSIKLACELFASLGLRVNNPNASAHVISSDHTFSEDEANYLTIINWLLDSAGYTSAWVDAWGVVQVTPYVEPTSRPVTVVIADDAQSIMYPQVVQRSDYQDTPNVVRCIYETADETLIAAASNIDPDSKISLTCRGYEVTYREAIGELSGETPEQRLTELKSQALRKLIDLSADVEYVDIKCAYHPIAPMDAIGVDYSRANRYWTGTVTSVSISLEPGVPTEVSSRRFVRQGFLSEVTGSILYTAKENI